EGALSPIKGQLASRQILAVQNRYCEPFAQVRCSAKLRAPLNRRGSIKDGWTGAGGHWLVTPKGRGWWCNPRARRRWNSGAWRYLFDPFLAVPASPGLRVE